jgi:hypothetical protein
VRGQIAVARGDLETAERALHEMRALPAGLNAEAQHALPLAQLEIDYRLAAGDLAWALEAARDLPEYNRATDPRYPWARAARLAGGVGQRIALGLAVQVGEPGLTHGLNDGVEPRGLLGNGTGRYLESAAKPARGGSGNRLGSGAAST